VRVDEVLDLDEAKTFLNLRTSVNDEELEGMIPAAIARVERHLDEQFVDVQVSETVSAFGGVLWPSHRPVKEVVSAELYGGTTTWVAESVLIDSRIPAVTSGVGSPFYGDVALTYVAGRTSVTAAEKLAVKMVLAEYWRTQRVEVAANSARGYASGVALEADAGPAGTAPLKIRLQELLGPAAPSRP
jgi:hypothetical protein